MQSITLRKIAEGLGLSVATVSRALNDDPRVRPATKERVLASAREYGYEINALARAVRSTKSRLVGLIVPDMRSEVFATVTAVIQHRLDEHGYKVILGQSGDKEELDTAYLQMFVQHRVDGIIHAPCTTAGSTVLGNGRRPPVVELVRRSEAPRGDSCELDDFRGAEAATRLLIEHGHRRIATIVGPSATSTSRHRRAGFEYAVSQGGLKPDEQVIADGPYSHEWGRQAALQILRSHPEITALFAASNQLASGALTALIELGLSVPKDVSLVGFEDPDWFSAVTPQITTYAHPLEQLGQQAVTALLARMSAPDGPPQRHVVTGELRTRHSVGSPLTT